jgi:phosphomevalonate kinase
MKKRPVIFLIGYKNTGKDTVAEMLNKVSGNQFDIVGFADALKKEYYATVGVEYDRKTEDRDFKEKHRDGIIRYGESMKHEKGMHHWIESALDPYIFKGDKGIIVPDCRRAEEVHWFIDFRDNKLEKYKEVRDNFRPLFIAVHRSGAENEDSDYLTEVAGRVATDNYVLNSFIDNSESLEKLKVKVEELYAVNIR